MIHWCPIVNDSDMDKSNKVAIMYKGAYTKSITSNPLALEENIVPNHLEVPTKNQYFHDMEEIKI